jgi:phosphoserine phosphatase
MIVVSDLMGTLTTGSPYLGLVDWVKHNQSKWRAYYYLIRIVPSYLFARWGWVDKQRWGQDLMIKSLAYIQDADEQKLREVSEWVVEHDLWLKRRRDVIGRLVRHRQQGMQVYIASSVVEPFIVPFAERIGASAIGTQVKVFRKRVVMEGELMSDNKKIEQVLSRLGVRRVDFAYGDTILDIPLLEHADTPVAVYPDDKLKAIAEQRGWEIFGNQERY